MISVSSSLNAKEEGYQPSLLGSVGLGLFSQEPICSRECWVLFSTSDRGRHQCVPIRHVDDPSEGIRYEQFPAQFETKYTGEPEDLWGVLLMTNSTANKNVINNVFWSHE